MKISEKISFLRKRKRLSQEQLAMKLDVSRQAVYKWEAGISVPEIDKIKKLALVFDVSYDFLLNDSLDISSLENSSDQVTVASEDAQAVPEPDVDILPILDNEQNEVQINNENQETYSTMPPIQQSDTKVAPRSKGRKLALIICLCVLGGILFLSLFTISLIKLLNELDIYIGSTDTGTTDSGSSDSGSSDTSTDTGARAHQVRFELPDGTVLKTVDVGDGMTTSAPSAPTITGYNFKGWYVGTKAWNKNMTYTESTIIKAVYVPVEYEIKYIYNGKAMADVGPTTYTIENEVALPIVSKEGYVFKGWYTDSSFSYKLDKIEVGTHGSIKLYARFEKNSHNINYVLYGGTNSYQNPSIYTINTTVNLKSPTHVDENAIFSGWYYDANFESPVGITLSGITKDITLYAKWEHKLYDFTFTDADCTIVGYKGIDSGAPAILYLPARFLNMPVISIAPYAFEGHELVELHLGNEALALSDNAFSGATIKEIYISENVLQISKTAFIDCEGLEKIKIASGNPWYSDIDGVAFNKEGTRLLKYPQGRADTSYTLPDTTNYIEAYAFYECKNLTEVTFPSRVGGIDNCAFKKCTSLKTISVGDILNYIGKEAFRNCSRLTTIELPHKLYSIGNYAFDSCFDLGEVKIPEGVDVLGYSVLSNCSALASVDLGKECSEISSKVFENCTSLASITIPETVTKIGSEAFVGCQSLNSVIINQNAIWTITFEKTGTKTTLTTSEIANASTIASYFTSVYTLGVWKNEGEAVSSDTVIITYNAGSDASVSKQSIEITKGTIYPYHPTPTCDDESKLFNGWFLDKSFNAPAEKYTVYTKDTTLYAKWIAITPCLDGTYEHSWGAFTTVSEGSCTSVELLSRTCTQCTAKISSYGNRNINNHTGLDEPYIEDFKAKIKCYSCNTVMESKEFENVTSDAIKEINIRGDVFGAQNLENMINGVWDEKSTDSIAPKGTGDVTFEITLDGAQTIDYVYVKGKGSAEFTVFVKYENEADYTLIGIDHFLSSEENESASRQIPFADVYESGTKRVVSVSIIIIGTPSDYLEEIGLFCIERA